MKCPHCGNKVDQVFLQQDNTFLMIQCTVCLFRCDGAYWEKVEILKDALKAISLGVEQRSIAPKMDGSFQYAPHLLSREAMRQIATEALEE